jgi:hypothetical protein
MCRAGSREHEGGQGKGVERKGRMHGREGADLVSHEEEELGEVRLRGKEMRKGLC